MSVPLREWLDSAPWLKGLPEGWTVRRFKNAASLSVADNSSHDDRLLSLSTSRGIVPKAYDDENRVRTGEDLHRYWKVHPGHVVVNPMWLAHGSVAASSIHGVISPDYRVYQPVREIDARYLAMLLQTAEYRVLYELFVRGDTTYDRRVSKDDFHSIPVVVPPWSKQRTIADYLERKTAAIDALIAKKERLIELLQEKRKVLITQAVTRGLDPNVRTKHSGIDWLGELPAHWGRSQPKHLCWRIIDGPHVTPDYVDEGVPFVTVKNLTAGPGIDLTNLKYISSELDAQLARRGRPERGDVLLSKDGTLGVPRVVETDRTFSFFVSVALLKPRKRLVDPYYLRYALEAGPTWQQFQERAAGAALKHIVLGTIGNVHLALPPIEEQRRIGEYLVGAEAVIAKLIEALRRHINLFREYRQALIAAAVTGNFDVTNEAT